MKTANIPERYRSDIDKAMQILHDEGCSSIYLFGSLITGKHNSSSDIDIGVTGLAAEKFFRVYSELDRALSARVDLVDFDKSRDFFELLNRIGELEKVG